MSTSIPMPSDDPSFIGTPYVHPSGRSGWMGGDPARPWTRQDEIAVRHRLAVQHGVPYSVYKLPTHFVGLPGELRNAVYKLVLTTDDGILPFRFINNNLRFSVNGRMAFNTLAHSSRQLRAETKNLHLKYNTIEGEAEEFAEWLRLDDFALQDLLRKIELKADYNKNPYEPHLHRIIDLAFRQPLLQIRIRLDDLEFNKNHRVTSLLRLAFLVMHAMRGDQQVKFFTRAKEVENWNRRRPLALLNATNLRFLPDFDDFDEVHFRHIMTKHIQHGGLCRDVLQRVERLQGDPEQLVNAVKGFYEAGLWAKNVKGWRKDAIQSILREFPIEKVMFEVADPRHEDEMVVLDNGSLPDR